MLEDIKIFVEENKEKLPLISHFWKKYKWDIRDTKENTNYVTSLKHVTTCYIAFAFYKPISTTINYHCYGE
jgi:hypothetical protein